MQLGTPVIINGRTSGTPGPATTTAKRIPIPNPLRTSARSVTAFARQITIQNLDATNNLLLYLGDNVNSGSYITLKPGVSLNLDCFLTAFSVQSSAGSVQWEAVVVVAA